MKNQNYTTTIVVEQSPGEVFNAINNVRGWWSENIKGSTDMLNAEFLYNYKDVHICKMKIIEFIPNQTVVWHVLENHFNFTNDKTEWKDDKILFEISEVNGKTQLQFTHVGLTPEYECFDVCNDAWTSYIHGSLQNLITKGKGNPNSKEEDLNQELIEKWNLPVK
ncbi:SRPBCC domain-containing protein [Flavobacterium terrisoli]|uniref:SRPBCC domain-containing protein n=1 Tax=Flavobacterium terrisoli TaxID=3242195 RepID=UPI002542F6BF|nr:SRPBCC domain-containing protein [Flavobacterium buctense]